MDPVGFSLENFDAVGAWRTRDGGTRGSAIDASGQLVDGTPINGVVELRKALLREPQTFGGLRHDGAFIYNAPAKSIPGELAALPATARAFRVDAAGIAAKEKCGLEAAMLGALCSALAFIDTEAVLETFRGNLEASRSGTVEASVNAFRRGAKEVEALDGVGERRLAPDGPVRCPVQHR